MGIEILLNGEPVSVEVDPRQTLLRLLRDTLGLTGPKEGCGTGACGTCCVLLDGRPVNSCLVFAWTADGARVETVEGLARGGRLHPLQEAFIERGATQCGFCIPGMLMTAKALLDEEPHPSEERVRQELGGNVCRCTGYVKIVEAILAAAEQMGG